jgi:NADPH-dependent 2,4-dienoyl-CoA reductase/sulfur reductase-like enzyme
MPRVHYLRTEADAHALKTALGSSRELAVVGGGLIGLEVAASAATIGRKVTVLEVAPRILWRVCDEETGSLIHEAHRSHGVDIRVGTALARVEPRSDGGFVLHTVPHPQIAGSQEHQQVSADLIVVGTGAKPDDRLALASGLTVDDGIVVDESCRTSDAAIFAAGDAVRFPGPHGSVRLENWRHAQDQGTIAGRNAAGAHEAYTTVPSFWSEQYDLYVQGVGWPTPGAARVRRPMPAPAALIFEITDGHLTYAMGVNAQRDLSMVRRLMERKIPVDAAALADPSASLQGMLKR